MIKIDDYVVVPTMFPDGTSQVWKIPEEVLLKGDFITWEFENEGELSPLLQLAALVALQTGRIPRLNMPYLVYGRQDKEISNTTTFAKNVIIPLLLKYFRQIDTLDAHSQAPVYRHDVISLKPNLRDVLIAVKPDMICYPDKGASERGYDKYYYPTFNLDKRRNQSTGEIEGLICNDPVDVYGKIILIQDDICDGGRTFIEATRLLNAAGAKSVCLYTTHGIYSKGTQVLFDSGLDRIFNHKGEVLNGN